ncbi:MAG TPA: DUF11 domain-containing protein, partial [Pirellulaceae bacterium]|nr:DUF11 domain-containing protein [Pirellulaceae bacterium]
PAEVSACDTINYKVTVKNTGTGTAKGVVVTDKLPDGLTGGDASGTYNVGDLAGGQSKDIMISARPTKTGSFSNSASVTSANGGSSSSNSVTTKVVKPALTVSVSCPGYVLGTSNITYKVTATNKGDAMCKDTRLEASIPAGTSFVSATNGGAANGASVVWTMPTLAAGQSANVEFVVHANDLGAKTTNVNVICVCADKATASCTTDVRGIPAILLEVVDENDPIRVGENEIYTITVTNQGTLKDTNVKLVVTLEDAQSYVSDSGPTKGTASGQVITFAPLPSIDPKARAEWKLVVKAMKASDIRIKVSMTSDQLTRPVEETESTNQYE